MARRPRVIKVVQRVVVKAALGDGMRWVMTRLITLGSLYRHWIHYTSLLRDNNKVIVLVGPHTC